MTWGSGLNTGVLWSRLMGKSALEGTSSWLIIRNKDDIIKELGRSYQWMCFVH